MIIVTLLSLIGAIALFLVVGWYIYVQQFAKYLKNIPGPTPWPVFGNALMFINKSQHEVFVTLFKEYGKIVKIWRGIDLFVLVADRESVEKVLTSTKLLDKAKLYKFMHCLVGTGLLTSAGPKWQNRIRMIRPSFHFQILKQFTPTFNAISNNLVEELRKVKNKECIDVHPYLSLAALDVICETGMGVSVNALQNKDSSYVKCVIKLTRIIMERVVSLWQPSEFLFQLSMHGYCQRKYAKITREHTMSIITKRREELGNKTLDVTMDEYGNKKKISLLDMLLQTSNDGIPLSDEDIREEVDTFIIAGFDTVTSAINFALFEIANNPEVQQKILQEHIEIFGSDNREVTYNDLSNMNYLEMVIKETLRLYPSAPVIARETCEDTQITDDICVSKGTTIGIMIYQIHRDPTHFANPEKFDPDRFLSQNNFASYCYIPFSAGPRNCIGQKYAVIEMKLMISKIVRHFELSAVEPAHKLELLSELILRSNNGVLINIKERSYN